MKHSLRAQYRGASAHLPIRFLTVGGLLLLFPLMTSCGYRLKDGKSALLEKQKIKTLYIAPLRNLTFKPGVENVVFNAISKQVASRMGIRIVRLRSRADAVLTGAVITAKYSGTNVTNASNLAQEPGVATTDRENRQIFLEYRALLKCSFKISVLDPEDRKRTKDIWNFSAARNDQVFQGGNQLDAPGRTSALINESEFDRSLLTLADSLANDAIENLISYF